MGSGMTGKRIGYRKSEQLPKIAGGTQKVVSWWKSAKLCGLRATHLPRDEDTPGQSEYRNARWRKQTHIFVACERCWLARGAGDCARGDAYGHERAVRLSSR